MWFQKKKSGLGAGIKKIRKAIVPGQKKIFSPGALLAGVTLGVWLTGAYLQRQRRKMDFRGKVVVITGGSRGLGLEMARTLAMEGARLAILARNEPELNAARAELEACSQMLRIRDLSNREDLPESHRLAGISRVLKGPALAGSSTRVLAIRCDVGQREQVEAAVRQVVNTFGAVDVLINDAGIVQVAPMEHLTVADYQDAMAVHFWGPLYTMLAVIPHMRRVGGGRIVNISSVGGKVAVPHMAPYVASKFALEGLSNTFRAELARENILVSTINPGLMRTGSFYHANFKGQQSKEFKWFSLLSSQPVTAMSSKRAAQQIITAARYGVSQRTLTFQARLLQIAEELFPGLMAWVMKTVNNRLLPASGGPQPNELKTGFESGRKRSRTILTALGEQAAERNNETLAERML